MRIIIIVYFLAFINLCSSQNIVVDETTNELIPFVSVSIKNTEKGFYSNKKGEFVLKKYIRAGDTLVFNSLGYEPKELIVGRGNKMDIIKLIRKIETLKEVVISKPKKHKTEELGIKDRKNSFYILGAVKLAVLIKNDTTQEEEGIIKKLIYRKLKIKSQYTICNSIKGIKCKTFKIKPKRDLALKLQLYNINKQTQLPDLNSPLMGKDIFIRLDKNKTIKHDISNLNIIMPKDAVFMYLEVLGVFNEIGEIITPKNINIFSFGFNRPKDKSLINTYGKYKDNPWSKNYSGNALFSMHIAYPIY